MPAISRMPSRVHTARSLVLVLAAVLVLGALSALATPARAAGTTPVASTGALGAAGEVSTDLTTKKLSNKAKKKKRLAKKRKQARIRARKARASQVKRVQRARGIALAQRGDRYAYGASGPHAFDCSGLVQFAFRNAGFKGMPRTSGAQAAHTRRISRQAMKPGDLMFFSGGGGIYHVAIFVGRGRGGVPQMVHASRPGTPVTTATPWTDSWFAGTMRPKGA